MLKIFIFLLFLTGLVTVNCKNVYKTIQTNSGPIRGLVLKTLFYEKEYYSFKGVPYAKPPVGELRFKAPEPLAPRSDPIDAFEFGNICSQMNISLSTTSEDCLYLNIFVPANNGSKKLPVLFWIHGGYYAMGSGCDEKGPDFYMENEVILVTINYRLGALGFMSLGSPNYSGNMGVKDQQLALKWIHENIGAFCGDNSRITIGGLSAGSKALGLHLFNKQSSKYFNQMLGLSGTSNTMHSYQKGDHKCLMKIFFKEHNSRYPNSDAELINFLHTVDVEKIVQFTEKSIPSFGIQLASPWSPIVENSDAKNPFLLEDPESILKKTTSISKNAYFTFTQYEQLYFIQGTNYTNPKAIEEYLNDFSIVLPIFGFSSIIAKKPYLKDLMQEVRNFYFGNVTTENDLVLKRLTMDSDLHYIYFIEKWLQRHVTVSNQNTFYHRFSAHTKLSEANALHGKWHLAHHADEQCYVFRCRGLTDYYKQIKAEKDPKSANGIAFMLMDSMQKLFSNFVKYGNPIHNGKPIKNFGSLMPNNANKFNFIDVTNDGLISGIAPNANRIKFLDYVIEEVKRLAKIHGDTPMKTPIQQRCDLME